MAIDFPASPTLGQQYTFNNITYIFSAEGIWTVTGTQFAPLASPNFSGNPQAPTAAPGDADLTIANTAFVAAAVGATGFTTGDVKPTLKAVADPGWVMMNDGTIGNAGSGSSTRANADTQALFTLLYGNADDNGCPIFTSAGAGTTRAGQGTAAAAFAANCRLRLPLSLSRVFGAAGTGGGLSQHFFCYTSGAESVGIAVGNLPSHTHPCPQGINFMAWPGSGSYVGQPSIDLYFNGYSTTDFTGGNQPIATMPPTTWINYMVKL